MGYLPLFAFHHSKRLKSSLCGLLEGSFKYLFTSFVISIQCDAFLLFMMCTNHNVSSSSAPTILKSFGATSLDLSSSFPPLYALSKSLKRCFVESFTCSILDSPTSILSKPYSTISNLYLGSSTWAIKIIGFTSSIKPQYFSNFNFIK
ncbi:hypothetical protein LguiB_031529 [Lonicera macranthoides]